MEAKYHAKERWLIHPFVILWRGDWILRDESLNAAFSSCRDKRWWAWRWMFPLPRTTVIGMGKSNASNWWAQVQLLITWGCDRPHSLILLDAVLDPLVLQNLSASAALASRWIVAGGTGRWLVAANCTLICFDLVSSNPDRPADLPLVQTSTRRWGEEPQIPPWDASCSSTQSPWGWFFFPNSPSKTCSKSPWKQMLEDEVSCWVLAYFWSTSYLKDHPRTRKWLMVPCMVIRSHKDRVVGPLPNCHSWLINGGFTSNYFLNWDDPPSTPLK